MRVGLVSRASGALYSKFTIETPHVVLKSDNTEKSQTKTDPTTTDMNLHYNIQIHLPETTNMAVYDAIFQSLKKHLM